MAFPFAFEVIAVVRQEEAARVGRALAVAENAAGARDGNTPLWFALIGLEKPSEAHYHTFKKYVAFIGNIETSEQHQDLLKQLPDLEAAVTNDESRIMFHAAVFMAMLYEIEHGIYGGVCREYAHIIKRGMVP